MLLSAIPLVILSQLSCLLAAPVTAIVTAGQSLNAVTFKEQVASETWMIEFYSPYCSHCKAFGPTWKQLLSEREEEAKKDGFNFAQVDCVANGDLCAEQSIKFYPSIFLYVDGVFEEEFSKDRGLPSLESFIETNLPKNRGKTLAEISSQEVEMKVVDEGDEEETGLPVIILATPTSVMISEGPMQSGSLVVLKEKLVEVVDQEIDFKPEMIVKPKDFDELKSEEEHPPALPTPTSTPIITPTIPLSNGLIIPISNSSVLEKVKQGPAFIKYHVEYCSHCKALKPQFEELAKSLQGKAVQLYSVDCDGDGKEICKEEGIQGYPTLHLYNEGYKADYRGPRKLVDMQEFVTKASISTALISISSEQEWEKILSETEETLFIYLHTEPVVKSTAMEILRVPGMGIKIYESSNAELLRTYNTQNGVVAIKKAEGEPGHFSLEGIRKVEEFSTWLKKSSTSATATRGSGTRSFEYSWSSALILLGIVGVLAFSYVKSRSKSSNNTAVIPNYYAKLE